MTTSLLANEESTLPSMALDSTVSSHGVPFRRPELLQLPNLVRARDKPINNMVVELLEAGVSD